jgi:YfiH family protein
LIRDPLGLRTFASFARIAGVVHAYAAADAFSGFDAARDADRDRLRAAIEDPDAPFRLIRTRQTHSARVACIERAGSEVASDVEFSAAGVDALVTVESGLLLHAISADCPLLFLSAGPDRGVAIAHCGWRGVARGIVEAVVRRLSEVEGIRPSQLARAAISPGAGACCYEVGDEVVAAIAERGVPEPEFVVPYTRRDGTPSRAISLAAAIRAILARCGVPESNVEAATECTICGGSAFHSHRRDGANAGRMSGVIGRIGSRK